MSLTARQSGRGQGPLPAGYLTVTDDTAYVSADDGRLYALGLAATI